MNTYPAGMSWLRNLWRDCLQAQMEDVRVYAHKLAREFSPLIAKVGNGTFQTIWAFGGRLNRVIDRVEHLALNVPEEMVDLALDVIRKITGIPSAGIRATRRVRKLPSGG